MKVAVGSDHGGLKLKTEIVSYLREQGISMHDFGTYNATAVDYPDIARVVAESVAGGKYERGILCCGTGIGVSIAANKVLGIRAALCHDVFSARMAMEHNQANIITLGERVVGFGLAKEIIDTWLKAQFAGGRHLARLEKIAAMERRVLLD